MAVRTKFTNEYIVSILRLIPRNGINVWELHRKVYELEKQGELPRHTWSIVGNAVRSAEIDALIGYLKLTGAIDYDYKTEKIYRKI